MKINTTNAGDCIIKIKVNVQLQTIGATNVACWDTLLLCVKTKEKSDMLKPNPHTVITVMNRERLKIARKSFMKDQLLLIIQLRTLMITM